MSSSQDRRQRKMTNENKAALQKTVSSFFQESFKWVSHENRRLAIREIFKEHKRKWAFYSYKCADGDKEYAQFIIDYFDQAIDIAHTKVATLSNPATALPMLRVLRYVQGKSKLRCFIREFPYWAKHILATKFRNNVKPPTTTTAMTATVTE